MTDGAPAIVASASSRRGWATVIYWYIVVIYRVNAREPCAPHSPFHSATLRLNCCHSWVPSPPPPTSETVIAPVIAPPPARRGIDAQKRRRALGTRAPS